MILRDKDWGGLVTENSVRAAYVLREESRALIRTGRILPVGLRERPGVGRHRCAHRVGPTAWCPDNKETQPHLCKAHPKYKKFITKGCKGPMEYVSTYTDGSRIAMGCTHHTRLARSSSSIVLPISSPPPPRSRTCMAR